MIMAREVGVLKPAMMPWCLSLCHTSCPARQEWHAIEGAYPLLSAYCPSASTQMLPLSDRACCEAMMIDPTVMTCCQ